LKLRFFEVFRGRTEFCYTLDPCAVQMDLMAINAKNSMRLRWHCPWWQPFWLAVGFGGSYLTWQLSGWQ